MKPLLIIVPILLIGGAFGAAYTGMINVPGITPKKAEAKKKPAADDKQQEEQGSITAQTDQSQTSADPNEGADQTAATGDAQQPETTTTPSIKTDPVLGAKALAKVWDEIDVSKLIPITESYKEPELALVLYYMNKTKVAQLMGSIDADRAAKLSRELQKLASVVKEEAE